MKKNIITAVLSLALITTLFYLASKEEVQSPKQTSNESLTHIQRETHITASHQKQIAQAIEKYFNKGLQNNEIVGAAVTIVKCDSIIYQNGYGKKNSGLNDHINTETIFRIGSVSKGFAGILSGIYVEQGLINWSDRVSDYIPSFELANSDQTKKITLSHLLSHTTGLPYHSFTNLVEDGVPLSNIASRFKDVLPIEQPGNLYSYQNAVFALSGKIIEQATGKTLKEVINEKIFLPLHMNTASASYEALTKSDNIALPHRLIKHGWQPVKLNEKYYNAIAAGGINASISDMGKWLKFLLGNNPEVMMPKTMSTVFNPTIQVTGKSHYYQRWPGYISSSYGFGWRIHKYKDETTNEPYTIIHHGGSVNDYRSEIAIYPKEDLGICVLFNSPNTIAPHCIPDLYNIIQEIIEKTNQEALVLL